MRRPVPNPSWIVPVIVVMLAGGVTGCGASEAPTDEVIRVQDLGDATGADSSRATVYAYDPAVRDGADVPYVTTPLSLVDSMLALADVSSEDVVYDLGSGDGRIPIQAARQYGARGVGIEIRGDLVAAARQHARAAGVADRVRFQEGDLFDADISAATVVTLYLLPAVNLGLRPKLLRELRPGTRVVSHGFGMQEWTPDRTVQVGEATLYLWQIPEEPPAFLDE